MGLILDVNEMTKTLTVKFPQYHKSTLDFHYGTDFPEVQLENPQTGDYVKYQYTIDLKDKIFINTYFRSNPRKHINNITMTLSQCTQTEYELAKTETPKYSISSEENNENNT